MGLTPVDIQDNEVPIRLFTKAQLCDYFASFVGMDGGNLSHAKLWLCGIEHGGDCEALKDVEPECEPRPWSVERRAALKGEHRSWPLWEKLAKVVVSAQSNALQQAGVGPSDMTWNYYRDNYLYGREAWEFKFNLFPLSCPQVDSARWSVVHREQPEIIDKEQYRNLCRNGGRFSFMRDLRQRHRPKVIVAMGVGSRNDFVRAFGFEDCSCEELLIGDSGNRCRLHVYVDRYADDSEARLVVTPFVSYRKYCLNSDSLLEELAGRAATWMTFDDFPALPK